MPLFFNIVENGRICSRFPWLGVGAESVGLKLVGRLDRLAKVINASESTDAIFSNVFPESSIDEECLYR